MTNETYASIDIGSNSILLLIAKIEGQSLEVLYEQAEIAALGKNIDKTGVFSKESMASALEIFQSYRVKLDEFKVKNLFVTATEASRVVRNSKEFFRKVKELADFDIEIISGEQEAYYATLGASFYAQQEKGLVLDVGGASSEIIKYKTKPFAVESFISLPIGSVRSTDWIEENIFLEKAAMAIDKNKVKDFTSDSLIAVAGTATALAMMFLNLSEFDKDAINKLVMSRSDFEEFVSKLHNLTITALNEKYSFLGKRAESIQGGAKAILEIIKVLKVKSLKFSTSGLRFGILVDKVLNNDSTQ